MPDMSNSLIPTNIQELFLPLSRVHSYSTRSSTSQNVYTKKLNLEIKKKLFLKTWCQIMEWDTNQVVHTFKTQIQIFMHHYCLGILETGNTYYETDEIILKMKKQNQFFCNPAYENSKLLYCFSFPPKSSKCIFFMFFFVRL